MFQTPARALQRSGGSLVARDQLIGGIVEVPADVMRLRAHAQHIVAGALDQRALPAGGDRAERNTASRARVTCSVT